MQLKQLENLQVQAKCETQVRFWTTWWLDMGPPSQLPTAQAIMLDKMGDRLSAFLDIFNATAESCRCLETDWPVRQTLVR